MKTISLACIFCLATATWSQAATTNAASAAAPHPAPAPNPNAISPAEWQELRTAHQEALKANPDLLKTTAELSQKMRDFQHKLDQAILQADPNTATVIARIENGAGQRPPTPPDGIAPAATPPPASQNH